MQCNRDSPNLSDVKAIATHFWMTFTMLSPTEGSASVARCDPDVGSSESGMAAMAAAAFALGGKVGSNYNSLC